MTLDQTADADPVFLGWSSGWDSTFRLLELAVRQERTVQPVYVIDDQRPSLSVEQRRMAEIRAAIAHRWPAAAGRILSLKTYPCDECLDEDIVAAYNEIRVRFPMGLQYAWLAALARRLGRPLEVGITGGGNTCTMLKDALEEMPSPGMPSYRVRLDRLDAALGTFFEGMHLPLIMITKADMARIAAAAGWDDVMALTWFCHRPDARGRPCGVCNPCMYTVHAGLTGRVGWPGMLRYHVAVRRRLQFFIETHPDVYRKLRRWKRGVFGPGSGGRL